jgi:uncharacterized protein YgbK (DUF1537 family)
LILAFADDLTGALEIGAKFAEHGLPATVVTDLGSLTNREYPVLVIDMETRHLTADEAGARTRELATLARDFAPMLVYQKTDSTLRGNIAAEMLAIQDVFSSPRPVYAPAYPDMGRTVRNGELFVWGTRVHETEFANDRWNPILDSRIDKLLAGVPALVLDGESNGDIEAAVHAILAGPALHVCAGPAALAEALARHLQNGIRRTLRLPKISRCLVVNGSLHPASIQQMRWAEDRGLFGDGWIRLDEPMEGMGMERAMRIGECVRNILNTTPFEAVIVFGGDTAFGIHRALGELPFQSQGEVAPGVPVSESGTLLWITKAGGFGPQDVLSTIRDRLT